MIDSLLAPTPGRPDVRIGCGPRAVEAALLDGLRAWSERVAGDPAQLPETG